MVPKHQKGQIGGPVEVSKHGRRRMEEWRDGDIQNKEPDDDSDEARGKDTGEGQAEARRWRQWMMLMLMSGQELLRQMAIRSGLEAISQSHPSFTSATPIRELGQAWAVMKLGKLVQLSYSSGAAGLDTGRCRHSGTSGTSLESPVALACRTQVARNMRVARREECSTRRASDARRRNLGLTDWVPRRCRADDRRGTGR